MLEQKLKELYGFNDTWIDYDEWASNPPIQNPDSECDKWRCSENRWLSLKESPTIPGRFHVPHYGDEIWAIQSDVDVDLEIYGNEYWLLANTHLEPFIPQSIFIPVCCLFCFSLQIRVTQQNAKIEVLFHYLDSRHAWFLRNRHVYSEALGKVFSDGMFCDIEDYLLPSGDDLRTLLTINNIKGSPTDVDVNG